MSFVLHVKVRWGNENDNSAIIIENVLMKSLGGKSFSLTWGRKTTMTLFVKYIISVAIF